MKILLIAPTYYSDFEQSDVYFPQPPLSLAYIAACLERDGHEVKILDVLGRNHVVRPVIEKFNPGMIGVQCYTTGFSEFKRLVLEIRTYYKGLMIAGGPHITAMTPAEMPDLPIDYWVRKEGEIAVCKLADGWRPENKVIDSEMTKDLNSLPLPARHLLEMDQYVNEPRTSMMGSRGCPYVCTFCFDSHQWREVRMRDVDAIVEEMKGVNKTYGLDRFFFLDDTFVLKADRVHQFADLLENTGFKISCNARCNTVNDEIMKDLKRMNVENLYFGAESGNQRLLNMMRKGITVKQIADAHELTKKYGIKTTTFMLMSIPTQTIKEMWEDIRFAKMLISKYKTTIDYSILYLYPNTPVFYEAKAKDPRYDIKDWSQFQHKWRYPNVPIYVDAELGYKLEDLIKLYRKFRFEIDLMQTPKRRLVTAGVKYVGRNVYRKLVLAANPNHKFNTKKSLLQISDH